MDISDVTRIVDNGMEIEVLVSPRSNISGTGDVNKWRKRLTVSIKSPPLDGKANREVKELFEDITGCKCEIIHGWTSRQKTIFIKGNSVEVLKKLRELQ
ncbi:MAG: DUF167 family protein [archaeon]|nr:DUF167 family protein [archaeon]